jgi:hypothetical protein
MLTAYAEHRTSQFPRFNLSSPILVPPSQHLSTPSTTSSIMNTKSIHQNPLENVQLIIMLLCAPCPHCNISMCLYLSPHVFHRRPKGNTLLIQSRAYIILFLSLYRSVPDFSHPGPCATSNTANRRATAHRVKNFNLDLAIVTSSLRL